MCEVFAHRQIGVISQHEAVVFAKATQFWNANNDYPFNVAASQNNLCVQGGNLLKTYYIIYYVEPTPERINPMS